METATLRVPKPLYEAIRGRAEAEQRSINNMAVKLLTIAVAAEIDIAPADWPSTAHVAQPSAAERDWATEDPIEPEPEPEDIKPLFAPIVDENHFKPDFKKGRK